MSSTLNAIQEWNLISMEPMEYNLIPIIDNSIPSLIIIILLFISYYSQKKER
jgi:hypothetical protein